MAKKYTEKEVLELMRIRDQCNFVYLDQEIDADDELNSCKMSDFIKDPSPTPDEIYEQEDLHNTIMKYVNKLSPREQKVTIMYYGFDGSPPKTLEAVGDCFGLSRERIRQILNKSHLKLKEFMKKDGITRYSDI